MFRSGFSDYLCIVQLPDSHSLQGQAWKKAQNNMQLNSCMNMFQVLQHQLFLQYKAMLQKEV